MSGELSDLYQQAADFAADLTRTVRAVAGSDCPQFQADLPTPGEDATSAVILVTQQPADGITLTVRGEALLTLYVEFRCWWDSRLEWLTVTRSSIRVHGRDEFSREPLLRYEYDRETYANLPAAHLLGFRS